MFEVEKVFTFEAGHVLEHHDGKCSTPHGHSYVMKVVVRKQDLVQSGPKQGMVVDFQEISAIVRPMIDQFFDHRWLNETLKTSCPTAEYMAKWVFEFLQPSLPDLYRVTISETATSSASYFQDTVKTMC
jgi:6-pyruvoyltetrahydropterin/6-carboxytetrahydropterin synthase